MPTLEENRNETFFPGVLLGWQGIYKGKVYGYSAAEYTLAEAEAAFSKAMVKADQAEAKDEADRATYRASKAAEEAKNSETKAIELRKALEALKAVMADEEIKASPAQAGITHSRKAREAVRSFQGSCWAHGLFWVISGGGGAVRYYGVSEAPTFAFEGKHGKFAPRR